MSEAGEGAPKIETGFISNRAVRKVPLDWEHPKDKAGQYIPLIARSQYPGYNEEEIKDMLKDGTLKSRGELETWFMPDFSKTPPEKMGITAYEESSDGTPISPVFPDTPEGRFKLLKHCADNQTLYDDIEADIESWAGILFGDTLALVDVSKGTVELKKASKTPPPPVQ